MRAHKMDAPNQGVKCVVNSCYYYEKGDHCTAEKIEIAPKNAANPKQTDCETFTAE